MTLRSLSRRLSRLERQPKGYIWIIDVRRFPGLSRAQAVRSFGDGRLPGSRDVVAFCVKGEVADPFSIMKYADLALLGDPEGRTLGQVIVETVQNSPKARLDSILKKD